MPCPRPRGHVGTPGLSRSMYAVLQKAQDIAKERGDDFVSTEHLLIALSADGGPGCPISSSAPGLARNS